MAMQKKQSTSGIRLKGHKVMRPVNKKFGMAQKRKLPLGIRLSRQKKRHVGLKPFTAVGVANRAKLTQTVSFSRAVKRSIDITKKNGNPVAKYDVKLRQAYLEYPDGTRAYVE